MTVGVVVNENDGFVQLAPSAGTTSLAFDFPIFDQDHIQIIRTRSGTDTTLAISTDYTVPSGSVGVTAGGTVTLVTPSVASDVYTLRLNVPIERTSDFNQAGDFLADTLNLELDLLTQQMQQLERDRSRGLSFSDTSALSNVTLPDPNEGDVIGWGPSNTIINYTPNSSTYISLSNIGGPIAGISSLGLYNSGGASGFQTTIQTLGATTAARQLSVDVGDANRTLTLGGNITTASNFITNGAFQIQLTATAATSVTLPTSGTLATTSQLVNTTILHLSSNPTTAVSAASTVYMGIAVHNASVAAVEFAVPFACTVTAAYAKSASAPGSGQQYAYTLVKNGSDSALTCTTSDTNSTSNGSGSVSYIAGDTISVKIVTSASAGATTHKVTLAITVT